jgi:hypothetical protein
MEMDWLAVAIDYGVIGLLLALSIVVGAIAFERIWAFCQVISSRSFKKECQRKGWVRATAYRRLDHAF